MIDYDKDDELEMREKKKKEIKTYIIGLVNSEFMFLVVISTETHIVEASNGEEEEVSIVKVGDDWIFVKSEDVLLKRRKG